MSKLSRPRKGSLQFYPRKRAAKFLPRVNWKPVPQNNQGILGFITYKVGMASAVVKDNTEKVMSSKKQVTFPVTVLEVPNMKIYSVRFYKNNSLISEVVVSHDKELKHKLRAPKQSKVLESSIPENYDDIRILIFSLPKQTSIKKTPDLSEIAISAPDKIAFVKNLIGKEISLADFPKLDLVDVRGLTKGRGLQGPVRRFGITLKAHKSEKGVRRPGSL